MEFSAQDLSNGTLFEENRCNGGLWAPSPKLLGWHHYCVKRGFVKRRKHSKEERVRSRPHSGVAHKGVCISIFGPHPFRKATSAYDNAAECEI